MCNSKMNSSTTTTTTLLPGRGVLTPAGNRVLPYPTRPLKKSLSFPAPAPAPEKPASPPKPTLSKSATIGRKSKNVENVLLFDARSPGSVAAAEREKAGLVRDRRKMRIAHYGRVGDKKVPLEVAGIGGSGVEENKCFSVTPNSDPMYVAYHDEEWGVPVHDDKLLFELLVLSGAQVGLDWTTILKKREAYRAAFVGFDAEEVSKFSEKQMASVSAEYGIELGIVRGVVDNSNRILEVKKHFGSLDKYFWTFVNNKPISTKYRSCRKIPVKTSKSEAISKDMVRRGFRFVGPTIVYSFMQAAGLMNDHLLTCPRHAAVASGNN